jgi:hypothetical protein
VLGLSVIVITVVLKIHRIIRGGGENGPVTVPAFKAGDSALRESNGGFDSHTLPPLNDNPSRVLDVAAARELVSMST